MGAYEMLPPGDIALIKFLGRPHTRGVCCWGDLDRFLKKFPYHPYIKQGGGLWDPFPTLLSGAEKFSEGQGSHRAGRRLRWQGGQASEWQKPTGQNARVPQFLQRSLGGARDRPGQLKGS